MAESIQTEDMAQSEYVSTVGGLRILVRRGVYSNTMVGVLECGLYEEPERKAIEHFLAAGDRVLEIGSAIGLVSMVVAGIVGPGNLTCFEANPACISDAQRNFALNGIEGIIVRNAVLRNRRAWTDGELATFYLSRHFWTSSLIRHDDITDAVEVPARCLEDELQRFGANAMICDIEGGEVALLEHAELNAIDKLLLETHYWAAGREAINRLVCRIINGGFSLDLDVSCGHVLAFRRDPAPLGS